GPLDAGPAAPLGSSGVLALPPSAGSPPAPGCTLAGTVVHALVQPSPSAVLPSSHCSPSSSTLSPQRAAQQSRRHTSGTLSEFWAASSHSSPGSSVPLPHVNILHWSEQLEDAPPLSLPSSHSSSASTTRSPHVGRAHVVRQFEPGVSAFDTPSSHSSSASVTESPQRAKVQSVLQAFGAASELPATPSSQSSDPLTMASPQNAALQ